MAQGADNSMSASQRNDVRAIAVDPSLSEILRQQTLLVLEANHAPFDDVRELAPAELLTVASIWRDAMAVLDTIGWLPIPGVATIDVVLTSGHAAQLRRLRRDEALAIVDCLEDRDALVAVDDLAKIDAQIRRRRLVTWGLGELLRRYQCAATS
jgi:hypothetical protein